MALGGIFALLDDISILMDDVAAMSKVAAKKTAGILGDDLAVNAEKSAKFNDDRELPVLWKITKGSFFNKLILLPIIFCLSYFLPEAIVPILIIGGCYLSYEGIEKVIHYFKKEEHKEHKQESEEKKIKSAILVDFILSIEIIIIALSTVLDKPFINQVIVVSGVSFFATIFVYGLVGLLIRMDNIGFWIQSQYKHPLLFKIGQGLISGLPIIIKILGIVGTIAMLLVAGGIFIHNIEYLHHLSEQINLWLFEDLLIGLIVGLITFCSLESIFFVLKKIKK